MITGVEYGRVNSLRGLSSDTKPTDVPNGSRFYEIDTGDTYIFDAEGVEWYKMPSSGGGPTPTPGEVARSDVNFYDYDGTLLHSYTKAEAQALTALPENPSHIGLVAQGWNYTLAEMKDQLTDIGECDIGQMYVSYGGGTHIFITLNDARLSPVLSICVNGRVRIDWGDQTTADLIDGSSLTTDLGVSHTYALAGDYIISIFVMNGEFTFGNQDTHTLLRKNETKNENYVYSGCVRVIWLGEGITTINDRAFFALYGLKTISIPNTITSIGIGAFNECRSLEHITIPNSVTEVTHVVFDKCSSLKSISIPNSVISIGEQTFNECFSLESIAIPASVTSIGTSALYCCYSLSDIILPSSITSISSSLFYYCMALKNFTARGSVTSIASNVFCDCRALSSFTGTFAITNIASSMFYHCNSLKQLIIPESVTSIDMYAFEQCYCLASITIPSSVTSIGSNAFRNCYGLKEIHFLPSTPPTLANSNAFLNLPTDCTIYVPTGKLSTYKSATNYPSASTYTYMEE